MKILKFFEKIFLKFLLLRFLFARHALFKEQFANKDLAAIGEIENTAQFIFDPKNDDWKWAPAREKTSDQGFMDWSLVPKVYGLNLDFSTLSPDRWLRYGVGKVRGTMIKRI